MFVQLFFQSSLTMLLQNLNFIFWIILMSQNIIHGTAGLLSTIGPTCTVTSLIPGTFQAIASSTQGTCYSALACRTLGGVAIGKCGAGNVCCVYPRTCDAASAQNHTYFVNPGYPSLFNGTNSCTLTVHRSKSLYRICQLRLDFIDFELNRPIEGNCETDRFVVSGQNSNSIIPALCGRNTEGHVYMDIDGAQGPFTLRVLTSGPGNRRWNIQVTQIECNNPGRAPSNCLQYYTGPSGIFSSFNYDAIRFKDFPDINFNNQINPITRHPYFDANYLNGLDYAICFRKESGFCTQTYSVNTTHTPFELINVEPNDRHTFDLNSAGAGPLKCVYDYVQLNGIRFCGRKFNPLGVYQNIFTDAPVTDTSSGPFVARVVTDYRVAGKGFKLSFQQNPCGSNVVPNPTQATG